VRTREGRAEQFMSEFNEDHSANGIPGQGSQPALPHHESPSMVPDEKAQESAGEPIDPREISIPSRAIEPASRATRSTVLLLTLPRPEDASAGPAPHAEKPRRFALSPAALSMIAVLIGAALGSAATAGLLSMNGTPAAPTSDPMTFTAALERIDHELTNLKATIEGSAKQSNAQAAKITDRLDRADKTQSDAAAKIARTGESLDRLDHRLTGNASGEATGAVPSASLAPGPAVADPRRTILEGWVLRDLFNGAAMIQSPRNGILEVIPGDNVPGLGRIEGIRRQDGRWVVVTSRGLIVGR
jgi:hypothetical protein